MDQPDPLDALLSSISHELRTPLNAILGWTRMLRRGDLPEERRDSALEIIERNALAQARLIQDILDYGRLMAGRLELAEHEVHMPVIVAMAIERMRPVAKARGVSLGVSVTGMVPEVSGDAERLQQVVGQLIDDAIRLHRTPGGKIDVAVTANADVVEVRVTDDGGGIDPDVVPYLFEASRPRGGLGLAVVDRLVRLHGGTIQVDGTTAAGTTFVMRLPLQRGRALSNPPVPAQGDAPALGVAALSGVTILVVDDDADARDLLNAVLGAAGAQVSTASSAVEAIASIAKRVPDLLITDIGLPESDGFALIRHVRGLSPENGGRVPAVALTGYASREDRLKALRAGFNLHVPKPIEPGELLVAVANLVGRLDRGDVTPDQAP